MIFGSRRSQNKRFLRGGAKKPSKPVYSYYSNRAASDDSAQLKTARQTKLGSRTPWWRRLSLLFVMAVTFICLGYFFKLDPNPIVIQPSGREALFLRDKNTYQAAAHKLFNNSVLNYNKITVASDAIASELKKQFPELAKVSITIPLASHRPVISLGPTLPALVLSVDTGTFVIDETGKAVSRTEKINTSLIKNLPTVTDRSNLLVEEGMGVLTASNARFITEVSYQLKAKNLTVKSLTLPAKADQLDVRLVGKPYVINMNMQNDPRQQVGAYLAAKKRLEARGQTPRLYFDVRVEERVYYR